MRLAHELKAASVPTRVPTIAIWELYFGIGAGSDVSTNRRDYEALLANQPIVDLTENIARKAGLLMGEHRQSDTKNALNPGDSIVAATALTLDEAVICRDNDFAGVDGLRIESF